MKQISLFLLIFSFSFCFAQKDSVNSLPCANRNFIVYVHEFLDTSFIPKYSLASLQPKINALNTAFSPICVSFQLCEKQDIRNYNFNHWYQDSMENEAIALYSNLQYINLYIVDKIIVPAETGGYASLGGISYKNSVIVMEGASGDRVWIHEFGHYFGLEHTHEVSHGMELANGSNGATAGDLIRDTPADPYMQGASVNQACEFQFGGKDANGDYYLPSVENYMSYYSKCTCRFSHQQYEKMYATYMISPKTHW